MVVPTLKVQPFSSRKLPEGSKGLLSRSHVLNEEKNTRWLNVDPQ